MKRAKPATPAKPAKAAAPSADQPTGTKSPVPTSPSEGSEGPNPSHLTVAVRIKPTDGAKTLMRFGARAENALRFMHVDGSKSDEAKGFAYDHVFDGGELCCGRCLRMPEKGTGLSNALTATREWSPRCWKALPAEAQSWWSDAQNAAP